MSSMNGTIGVSAAETMDNSNINQRANNVNQSQMQQKTYNFDNIEFK